MPLNNIFSVITFILLILIHAELIAQPVNNPKMVLISKGSFMMGCSFGNGDPECRPESAPQRKVDLGSFDISETEITQMLWSEVMGYNNSDYKGDERPVENVSWYEAIEFCNKLSVMHGYAPVYKIDKTKKDPAYYLESDKVPRYLVICDFKAGGYRLPTEAEWEFAARGGSSGKGYKYAGADTPAKAAVYAENSSGKTKPVKSISPNEAGLYDMSGNVAEWCWDWYGSYADLNSDNPIGAEGGTGRVYRGGSWIHTAEILRNDARGKEILNYTSSTIGFRVVRSR